MFLLKEHCFGKLIITLKEHCFGKLIITFMFSLSYVFSQAVAHAIAWQSRSGSMNCWSLLADLWGQEEKNMVLPREDMPIITNSSYYHF